MWEFFEKFATAIIERTGVLLIMLGVILFVLGAAGGIPGWLPIENPYGQLGVAIVGALLITVGIFAAMISPVLDQDGSKYGVKIESPKPGESVTVVNVVGTIKKKIPKGYALMILRIYPDAANAFIPLKEVDLSADKKSWTAFRCDIGGMSKERRALGVYLVGPSGQALFRYFREASTEHNLTKQRLERYPGEKANYLPLIQEKTRDMIKCAEVPLVRE